MSTTGEPAEGSQSQGFKKQKTQSQVSLESIFMKKYGSNNSYIDLSGKFKNADKKGFMDFFEKLKKLNIKRQIFVDLRNNYLGTLGVDDFVEILNVVYSKKFLRVYFGYEISFAYVTEAMAKLDAEKRKIVTAQVVVSNPWEDFTHSRLNELEAGARRLHGYNKYEGTISENFAIIDVVDWVKQQREEQGNPEDTAQPEDIFAKSETKFNLECCGQDIKIDGIVVADNVILCETKHNLNNDGSKLKALEQLDKAVKTWNKLRDVVLKTHDLSEKYIEQAKKDIEQFNITEDIAKKTLCIALAGYFTKKSTVVMIQLAISAKFPELQGLPLLFVELGERKCMTVEDALAVPERFYDGGEEEDPYIWFDGTNEFYWLGSIFFIFQPAESRPQS